MHREAHELMVLLATTILAATLVTGAVIPMLQEAMAAGEAPPATTQAPPGPPGYLEAVLVRMDLQPSPTEPNATEPTCQVTRQVKTSYRPAILIDRVEPDCTARERIDLTFHLDALGPIRLQDVQIALCDVQGYTMKRVPAGEMVGGVSSDGCRLLTVQDGRWSTSPVADPVVTASVPEEAIDEPGLKIACATAQATTPDGESALVRDMTWFEAWSPEHVPTDRGPHGQSQARDVPCQNVGLPLPDGWPTGPADQPLSGQPADPHATDR